ncbi:MAG: hypothetical protein GEV07_30455 [Streptosporangiales bacterium]|nr:hypothetical protein [Streptosporangiales bacterium]
MPTTHQHPTPLAFDELVAELRAWATGDLGLEAAVNLLTAHRSWLARRDFRDTCVVATPGHLVDDFDLARVWLDFAAAARVADGGQLPASDSERQILALAAGLAGYATSRPLHDLITGLDQHNTGLVLDAIAHTAGRPAASQAYRVTGSVEEAQ